MTAADLKELVEGYRRLSTANVSDGLDRAGSRARRTASARSGTVATRSSAPPRL